MHQENKDFTISLKTFREGGSQQREPLESDSSRDEFSSLFISTVNTISSGVMILESLRNILFFNQRIKEITESLKINQDDLLELVILDLTKKDILKRVLEKNTVSDQEAIITIGERELHLKLSLKPIIHQNKDATLLIIEFLEGQELSGKLKERIKELKHTQQEQKMFYQMVVHDLKNPLGNMKTNMDLLRIMGKLNESQSECSHIIDNDIDSMSQMVISILDKSRMESHNEFLNIEDINLGSLVLLRTKEFKNSAAAKGLTLVDNDIATNLIFVGEPLSTISIIDNLLSNAVKYSDGGNITVSLEETAGYALLKVSDEGRGIPEEEQGKIFNEYYQVGGALDDESHGFGLYTTKKLVEKYHGKISVSSTPGKGSEFTVILPLHQ